MNAPTKQKHNCDDEASEAIDKVLRQVFGDEATCLIYRYLKNRYSLKQDEIVEKIDVFAKGLKELLKSGAYTIEMEILEEIHSSHGLSRGPEFERKRNEYDFVSQMKTLRAT
jgi:hypothetical protein